MSKNAILYAAIIIAVFLFPGCFGGQPEEEASIDINISEEIKEMEGLQKQIKTQSTQLQKLQRDLKKKKASTSGADSAEVKKLEKQIEVQQKEIIVASKKVTTVKAEKAMSSVLILCMEEATVLTICRNGTPISRDSLILLAQAIAAILA